MPRIPGKSNYIHATAVELLSDGEWHDFAKIRAAVAKAIPPGQALRAAQKRLTTPFDRNDRRQQQAFIRSGQKLITMSVLSEKSRFERKGDQIRLVPYAEITFEQYSEASKRGHASRTAAQRRAAMKKANETLGPEGRSERSRRSWAAITPEERSARGRRVNATVGSAVRSAQTKAALAKTTPEWRSERARKAWATRRAQAAAKAQA